MNTAPATLSTTAAASLGRALAHPDDSLLVLVGMAAMRCPVDRLEYLPLLRERPGEPLLAVVQFTIAREAGPPAGPFIVSAPLARRAAELLESLGRLGAALDLLRGCELAEAIVSACNPEGA